jgi:hypothetical protein
LYDDVAVGDQAMAIDALSNGISTIIADARSRCCWQLALLALSLGGQSNAIAGDYDVAYAVSARGAEEVGVSRDCTYERDCRLEFQKSAISLSVYVTREPRHRVIYVTLGRGPLCCFFSDAVRRVQLDERQSLFHLRIFEGKARVGNEAVVNKEIGELFLGFASFQ